MCEQGIARSLRRVEMVLWHRTSRLSVPRESFSLSTLKTDFMAEPSCWWKGKRDAGTSQAVVAAFLLVTSKERLWMWSFKNT